MLLQFKIKKNCLECDEFNKEQINFEYNYKLQNYYDSMNDISKIFEQEINEELLFQFYDEEYDASDTDSENSVLDIDMETNLEDVFNFDVSNLNQIFTTNQICVIKLLKLLEDMQCPDTAMEKILTWARECFLKKFDFNPPSKTRRGNLKWMKKWFLTKMLIFPNLLKYLLMKI